MGEPADAPLRLAGRLDAGRILVQPDDEPLQHDGGQPVDRRRERRRFAGGQVSLSANGSTAGRGDRVGNAGAWRHGWWRLQLEYSGGRSALCLRRRECGDEAVGFDPGVGRQAGERPEVHRSDDRQRQGLRGNAGRGAIERRRGCRLRFAQSIRRRCRGFVRDRRRGRRRRQRVRRARRPR